MSGPNAAEVVRAAMAAFRTGDLEGAATFFHKDLVYHNLNLPQPFDLHGRDTYFRYIASMDDLYTEKRTARYDGVVELTAGMAAISGDLTVGDVTVGGALVHLVVAGRVVELFDMADNRARAFSPFLNEEGLARWAAVSSREADAATTSGE